MALYDSIATQYDTSRGYPAAVQAQLGGLLVGLVVERNLAAPRFVEIGAGSGRVGLLVAAQGVAYVGTDESVAMLRLFAGKLATAGLADNARLVQADAKLLPCAAASFDVGLAVHVFHLVGDWRPAADELRRVVKPRGLLLFGFDVEDANTPYSAALAAWGHILDVGGVPRLANREAVGDEVIAYLVAGGAQVTHRTLLQWQTAPPVAQLLHDQQHAGFCRQLHLPPAELTRYIGRLQDWLFAQHGSLDAPLTRKVSFEVSIIELPSLSAQGAQIT